MAIVVGKDPKYVRRVTCTHCASIVEYTQSETRQVRRNWDYLGDSDLVRVLNCAGCGKEIQVHFIDRGMG